MTDLFADALSPPMAELKAALIKKLSSVDRDRLAMWMDEERRAAEDFEWERQKPRVMAAKALLEACEAMVAAFLDGSHYEVQNPYTRPYVKAALAAIARAKGED